MKLNHIYKTFYPDTPKEVKALTDINLIFEKGEFTTLSGESGSGKERVARMIHQQGSRSEGPFVPVNCGAIPAELMESEFFGHLKGSFTGATSDKEGLFQAASGGTLFLDEIAELPLNMQVKLLRVIQEKAIRAVGAAQESPVDVRILSASHKNLVQLVADGAFREDLYYRINVIELTIPSLRERQEDIPLFVEQLLGSLAEKMGMEVPEIDDAAISALLGYHYPGNVRELENIIAAAVLQEKSKILTLASTLNLLPYEGPERRKHVQLLTLEELEKRHILNVLDITGGNRPKAAKILGVNISTVYRKIEKYNLDRRNDSET